MPNRLLCTFVQSLSISLNLTETREEIDGRTSFVRFVLTSDWRRLLIASLPFFYRVENLD